MWWRHRRVARSDRDDEKYISIESVDRQSCQAEAARRKGDTVTVYTAYSNLAQYFQNASDPKTGVYFYEKCLEVRSRSRRRTRARARVRLFFPPPRRLFRVELSPQSCVS